MSNPDSFIDEVTEEVRRDKLFAFFRKWGWIPILMAVALVGGAAWSEYQKARATKAAEAFGDSLMAAVETTDIAARKAALAAVVAEGPGAAVLHLLTAADAVEQKDRPAAYAALDALIADASLPQSYRDLARLKRVMLAGADMPAADRLAALDDLATPGRPFRPLAMEQRAMDQIGAGETAAGITALQAVLQEPQASQNLKSRVDQVLTALGVAPEAK